jgi:hypothetical protein
MSISMADGYSERELTPELIAQNEKALMSSEPSLVTAFGSRAVKNLLRGFRIPGKG